MSKKRKATKTENEAAIVAAVLADLARRDGRNVRPEVLVNEARDEKHPLHDRFEWDDSVAAHKHRLDQARRLISSVRVTYREEKITSVAYIRDPALSAHESGYISVKRLRTEADNALIALEAEIAAAVVRLERARELAVALDLVAEFNELWAAAQTFKSRMRRGTAIPEERPSL